MRTNLNQPTPRRVQEFLDEVIKNDKFCKSDLDTFNLAKALKKLDKYQPSSVSDTWKTSTVKIPLPYDKVRQPESEAPTYDLAVKHRSLLNAIKSTLESSYSKNFVYHPSKHYRMRPNDASESVTGGHDDDATMTSVPLSDFEHPGAEHVYDEFYHSDAWIEEHEKLQKLPPGPEGPMENVIIGIGLSSDGLKPTNFGSAYVCPCYMTFCNDPKSRRRKPSVHSHQQVAYFPKIKDDITDHYRKHFGSSPSRETLTHLSRECHNSMIDLLLDEEFMHAYEHGFVQKFSDGVTRRAFPRFFIYSADYPEK